MLRFLVLSTLLLTSLCALPSQAQGVKPAIRVNDLLNVNRSQLNPKAAGAKGNGIADDRVAILASVLPNAITQFEAGASAYKVGSMTSFANMANVTIDLGGATIQLSDTTQQGFYFQNCPNINFKNGTLGYAQRVHKNGGGQQHILMFQNCNRVTLDNVKLLNSPEMGLALVNCQNVTVKNGVIGNTMRDGIYARYCNEVVYDNLTFFNCKDDAMGYHDKDNLNAGTDPDKLLMVARGFRQASNVTVRNVRVFNCYQGFSSIGASNIVIDNMTTRHTVGASIAVFHIPNSISDTTRANNIKIVNCTLDSAGRGAYFAGIFNPNYGRTTTGRASIFIGSLGNDGAGHLVVNAGESKRVSEVTLENNTIRQTGSNGLWISLSDIVKLNNNTFINAANVDLPTGVAAIAVEMASVTQLQGRGNLIVDTRPAGALQYGVKMDGVQILGSAEELFTVTGAIGGKYLLPGAGIIGGTTPLGDRVGLLESANQGALTVDLDQYAKKSDVRGDTIRTYAGVPPTGNFWFNTLTGLFNVRTGPTSIIALGGAGGASTPANTLNDGLVAAYSFDETSGDFADAKGAHPATAQGTLIRGVAGHRGNAVNFINGFAQVTGGAILTGSSFSLSVWVRNVNGGSNRPIFATKNGDAGSLLVRLGGGNGPLALKQDSGPDYFDTPSNAPYNQDTHIVVTYDSPSKQGRILIDDVLVATTTTTNSITFATGTIELIGSDGRGSNAEVLDDLVIANRAWSLAECHAIHTQNFVSNNPSAPFP